MTSSPGAEIVHWNGKSWTKVACLGKLPDKHLAAVSADDIWAIGGTAPGATLTLRWNGKSWARSPDPRPRAAEPWPTSPLRPLTVPGPPDMTRRVRRASSCAGTARPGS